MNRSRLVLFAITLLLSGCYTLSPGGTGAASQPAGWPAPSELEAPEPHPLPDSSYSDPEPYTVLGETYHVMHSARGYEATGIASWYGRKFHGQRTASGEIYNMYEFTAAHKTLPLQTWVRVTNLENGRTTVVRINDRGPFHGGRIIDLSRAAAIKLGMAQEGTARVHLEAITFSEGTPDASGGAASPSSSPSAVSSEPLYLQVGAFLYKRHATDLLTRLIKEINQPVALRPGERFYRVWVGPFYSQQARKRARQQLKTAGFTEILAVSP